MRPLPFNVPGFDNDLNEKLDRVMQRAVADENALVYAFGERWGPEPGMKDKYFGFLPGNGIHDIHMNQGNVGRFVSDDGVYPGRRAAGALSRPARMDRDLPEVPVAGLAHRRQDRPPIGARASAAVADTARPPPPVPEPPTADDPDGLVRIVAALVNATQSPEVEVVTLLNTAPHDINLAGWALLDTQKKRLPLTDALRAGATRAVQVAAAARALEQGRRDHAGRREGPEGARRVLHEGAGAPPGLDDRVLRASGTRYLGRRGL